jgi:pimeloyl-ACP methyl ester carboxylesterase
MKFNIEKYYSKIPTSQKVYIQDFERTHAEKSLVVRGVPWQYLDSGGNQQVLLLLHGGFADTSMWIHQITTFEKTYRIIAPTCPAWPDAKMKDYSGALRAILTAEKIENVYLMGYSEGGLIAQCFLRDHPTLINKVMLGHTFYPSPENKYAQYDFNLFRILPATLTESIFKWLAKPDKEEIHHSSTEWLAWYQGWFRELKSKLTKALILTHIDLMMDFVRNYTFNPADLYGWGGKILITVAADDIVLRYFEGMKQLYPQAETHVFEAGLGAHSVALITPAVFNQRIGEFLAA